MFAAPVPDIHPFGRLVLGAPAALCLAFKGEDGLLLAPRMCAALGPDIHPFGGLVLGAPAALCLAFEGEGGALLAPRMFAVSRHV